MCLVERSQVSGRKHTWEMTQTPCIVSSLKEGSTRKILYWSTGFRIWKDGLTKFQALFQSTVHVRTSVICPRKTRLDVQQATSYHLQRVLPLASWWYQDLSTYCCSKSLCSSTIVSYSQSHWARTSSSPAVC